MKLKLNKILKIVFIIVFSIYIIVNIGNVNTQADSTSTDDGAFDEIEFMMQKDEIAELDLIDGAVGLITYPMKLLMIAAGTILRAVVAGITYLAGDAVWSVDEILFNTSGITSINFFDGAEGDGIISTIRKNVATWYYVVRNLSIVILLGILLYVGIRMAISTVASDEAKYKKMLKDWIVSMALIFVLQYIMIFTIECNDVLVNTLSDARVALYERRVGTAEEIGGFGGKFDSALNTFLANSFSAGFSSGYGSAFIYMMLIGVTLIFLVMYIKRMLTIGFLIIIAPLITITYSVDKMGNGKAEALNTWLKEFVFNVLIQPFHCIIYIVFVDIAMDLVIGDRTIASAVLAIIMLIFIFTAEKIVKKMFNFQASSLGEAIASTTIVATAMDFMNKRGKKDAAKEKDISKIPNMSVKKDVNINNKGGSLTAIRNQKNVDERNKNTNNGTNKGNNKANMNSNNYNSKMPVQQNDLGDKIKRNIKSKAKTIAGQVLNPFSDFNRKLLFMSTMAALGASTGSGKGIISGLYAGNSLAAGSGALLNNHSAKKMVKNNERVFAGALNNFQQKENLNDTQVMARTMKLLNADYKTLENMSESEGEYYAYIKNLQNTYRAMGEDNVDDKVLETVTMIQNGEIQPQYEEIVENISPVATQDDNVEEVIQTIEPEENGANQGLEEIEESGSQRRSRRAEGTEQRTNARRTSTRRSESTNTGRTSTRIDENANTRRAPTRIDENANTRRTSTRRNEGTNTRRTSTKRSESTSTKNRKSSSSNNGTSKRYIRTNDSTDKF